jgi:hypothetical protein
MMPFAAALSIFLIAADVSSGVPESLAVFTRVRISERKERFLERRTSF